MSTADSKERLEEAKIIQERIKNIAMAEDGLDQNRVIMILAGMLTETLLEYEEPDAVMEQSFFRISDLMGVEPMDGEVADDFLPMPYDVDKDTELGRKIALLSAERLPKGLDDIHEITIALIINDLPQWAEEGGRPIAESFRLLVECVITSLIFEMAVQEFCDLLIEEFIPTGWDVTRAVYNIAALGGHYLHQAETEDRADPAEMESGLFYIMASEAARHGVEGSRDWNGLGVANDRELADITTEIDGLKDSVETFFEAVSMTSPLEKASAVIKTAGRMVAIVSYNDAGYMQPSVAKSIARTGFLQGREPSA